MKISREWYKFKTSNLVLRVNLHLQLCRENAIYLLNPAAPKITSCPPPPSFSSFFPENTPPSRVGGSRNAAGHFMLQTPGWAPTWSGPLGSYADFTVPVYLTLKKLENLEEFLWNPKVQALQWNYRANSHKLFEPFSNFLFSVYLILPPICLIIHEFG